jgi:excisionase family DNA binding protein
LDVGVSEAAQRLSLDPSRVRRLIRSGGLHGRQVGRQWLIPAEDLARFSSQRSRPGRPLAPARAWALLDLLEGGKALWLSPVARSQVRQLLRGLEGAEASRWRSALRARSHLHRVSLHRAALLRLEKAAREGDRVFPAGPAVAAAVGADLVVVDPLPEFYVSEQAWPILQRTLHLNEARGNPGALIRVPRGAWLSGGPGAAALAADLLDNPESRAVDAGTALLNSLAAGCRSDRCR